MSDLLAYINSINLVHRRNSPNTVVYNQCANLVLENAIKKARSIENSPKLLSIEGQELPDMIKPSDVDCVVAGFPW